MQYTSSILIFRKVTGWQGEVTGVISSLVPTLHLALNVRIRVSSRQLITNIYMYVTDFHLFPKGFDMQSLI